MNWQHFQAFLWLRYRLFFNRVRRSGVLAAVILGVMAILCLFLSAGMFVGSVLVGLFAMNQASPTVHLLVWDGIVGAFLFVWVIVLLSDLQRSEPLSLEKFLHLPVSLTGAFIVNYVSSLVNLRLVVFVPAMIGLLLGLAGSRGPAMLLCLPLLAAFLLVVTALTHQFQGWLASLMSNPRRRRSVVVFVTLVVVAIIQVPNLVMQVSMRKGLKSREEREAPRRTEGNAISAEVAANSQKLLALEREKGNLTQEETNRRLEEIKSANATSQEKMKRFQEQEQSSREQKKQEDEQEWQQVGQTARVVNMALPPGWLPLGVSAVAEGNVLPALLGTLGLGLIGVASLRRSYRTTRRLYTGQVGSSGKPAAKVESPATPARTRELLLERKIPGLSEPVAAVALAAFRSLVRAPEAKMMLLSPVILVGVMGMMFFTQTEHVPEVVRPLIAYGVVGIVMLSMLGFLANQFGFDRNGFRVYVLCGARRRDILLGKNLAFVPHTVVLAGIVVVLLQCMYPMPAGLFLSVLPQAVSMYLVFCMLSNWLSILAPLAIPAGAMRPTNIKAIPLLLHLAFLFLFPVALSPTLLPLGVEYALGAAGWGSGVPVCLLLSVFECAIVAVLYFLMLTWQGYVLQAREQRILEIVTSKSE